MFTIYKLQYSLSVVEKFDSFGRQKKSKLIMSKAKEKRKENRIKTGDLHLEATSSGRAYAGSGCCGPIVRSIRGPLGHAGQRLRN